jgi:hypothetical protein
MGGAGSHPCVRLPRIPRHREFRARGIEAPRSCQTGPAPASVWGVRQRFGPALRAAGPQALGIQREAAASGISFRHQEGKKMAKETKSSSKKAAASPGASGSSSSGTSASGSDAGTKRARSRAGRRGVPRGRVDRDLRPRVSGKTTLTLHVVAEAQKAGRHRGVHRRGARPGSHLRQEARRRHRRPAREPARHRRAGARDLRDAGAFQRRGRHRGRLGRGAGPRRPRSRARWATPTSACRPA